MVFESSILIMDNWFESNILIVLIMFLMLFVVESVNDICFQLRQTWANHLPLPQKNHDESKC